MIVQYAFITDQNVLIKILNEKVIERTCLSSSEPCLMLREKQETWRLMMEMMMTKTRAECFTVMFTVQTNRLMLLIQLMSLQSA